MRVGRAPEPFEVVERALVGREDVRDDRAEIDEDPAAVGVALGARDGEIGLARFLDDGVGDRTRLNDRSAGRDDEGVGDDRPPFEREGQYVVGFEIEGGFADEVEQIRQRAGSLDAMRRSRVRRGFVGRSRAGDP